MKEVTDMTANLVNDTLKLDALKSFQKKQPSAKEKHIIGYATGVFDLFHVGHLNVLKVAKENCDFLIAGVSVDSLVEDYKGKKPVIPFEERIEIVRAIKYVDIAVPQINMDKMEAWAKYRFNKIFLGEEWRGTEIWDKWERVFRPKEVEICYVAKVFHVTSSSIAAIIVERFDSLNGRK